MRSEGAFGSVDVRVRDVSLEEARLLPAIPSGFHTDTILRVARRPSEEGLGWELHEEKLGMTLRKEYDTGDMDEWFQTYEENPGIDCLRFISASLRAGPVGLLAWCPREWNCSTWLVDVRVDPGTRRRGVGSAMVEHLKSHVRRLEMRGITVETQCNNMPAVKFYRRQGFEVAGLHDRLYTNQDLLKQDVAIFLFWENH